MGEYLILLNCHTEEADLILSMADLNGDRKVSLDQVLHTASMMSWSSSAKKD